jgi:hypothetical protein
VRSPPRSIVDVHSLLCDSQICQLGQLGEIQTLVVAKVAEVATSLTPIQLPIEADGLNLKDELVFLKVKLVNLKKLGYNFTDNLRDTQLDVEDSDARQCVLGPNLIMRYGRM